MTTEVQFQGKTYIRIEVYPSALPCNGCSFLRTDGWCSHIFYKGDEDLPDCTDYDNEGKEYIFKEKTDGV